MSKRIVTGLFVAMLIFTVAFITATIVQTRKAKEDMVIDPEAVNLVQLDTINGNIADDAEVAIITTEFGEIRIELYPQYAPETVARFKELAQSGYYDGTFIYEVQKDIYFSGGSPYSDGTLEDGYDKKSEKIDQEISKDLWPFKGAFMSSGLSRSSFFSGDPIVYGGSRFIVAGSIDFNDEIKEQLYEGKENTKIEDAFVEYGGIPNASQQFTIFAQTYEGFDVLDQILSLEADEDTRKPLGEPEIISIKVLSYKESLEN